MNLKLSELRKSKGLTQKQAALLCSTPEGTYKCYEYDTMEVPGVVYGILAAMPDSEVITKDSVVDNVTLGKFLEATRLSKDMLIGDVAVMVGMTRPGYRRYELGQVRHVTKDMLGKIAAALSLDVKDLAFKEVTVRPKPAVEIPVIPKPIIEPPVHSEDITAWLRTSDSTQWVAMAYYNYLKYKQRKP